MGYCDYDPVNGGRFGVIIGSAPWLSAGPLPHRPFFFFFVNTLTFFRSLFKHLLLEVFVL